MLLCQQDAALQITSHHITSMCHDSYGNFNGNHNLVCASKNSDTQICSVLGFVSCTDAMASFYSGGQDVRRPRR